MDDGTLVETITFLICAAVVLAGAIGVIFSRNPVNAALSLVATLFGVAVLFVTLEAHLLAAVQVIVYTGAIVVLILFVMMLLGVDRREDLTDEPLPAQRAAAVMAGLSFLGIILVVLVLGQGDVITGAKRSVAAIATDEPNINQIGRLLFTDYVFAFELTAALLTIAVVGAVVLARKPRSYQPVPEPASMELEPLEPEGTGAGGH
jgi:NADH-quinone oxidoreductase subunit J